MPTVLFIRGYRFFFYSLENNEPSHIHVDKDNCVAKFWLDPVRFENSKNFKNHELNEIERIITENQSLLIEKWYEYFK
jgi:hypothetical protein